MIGLDAHGRREPEILRSLQAGRGLPLAPEEWAAVSCKGGSEPGVLSLTWLVEDPDGRRHVVSGIVNDPENVIDQGRALAIMARAFEFLAGS